MLYGGGWLGSPIPTAAPANGRFNRSALEVIVVGRFGNRKGITAAGTTLRTKSGEKATTQPGSQYPQKPVPGACSRSAPQRSRWGPFCHVILSMKVYRRRSRPWVAFSVFPTVKFEP